MNGGEAFFVSTNSKDLVENKNSRSRAEWKESMAELCTEGLLEEQGHKGEQFKVTAKGWRLGESLRDEDSHEAIVVEQSGKQFGKNTKGRLQAEWVEALQVLEARELLDDQTGEGRRFKLTGKGCALARTLE